MANKKKPSINRLIKKVEARLEELDPIQNAEEYETFQVHLRELNEIKAINADSRISPNMLVEGGVRLLIASAVVFVEHTDVLRTKLPLADLAVKAIRR